MSSIADELFESRDLLAVGGLVAVSVVTIAVGTNGVVRLPPAVLLLLVLPGYVTAAFAYAEREREPWTFTTLVERFALALGGSLAILPLLAIVVYLAVGALTTWGLVGLVAGYVVVVAGATTVRRAGRSGGSDHWAGPARSRTGRSSSGPFPGSLTPLTAVLAVSMILAVGALGAAVTVPADGETATDLHLLTEQEGRLVANEYPSALTQDESAAITVGVTNDEHRSVEYTVVTELQRVRLDGRSVVVTDKRRIDQHGFELAQGESWRESEEFRATLAGENVRFVAHLYRGDPPENPTADTAYRTTYVWFDVQPSPASGE
ncbi:hypothetical protein C464_10913 [Halorubrum coriense DSM 10284]|uniref:DUF1616 domain-containing protein n=1 Tax=Halorubrum coriense DSM 10284 TaxID=1227466 RepID=M0EEY4_9EURY|nr:DUF1616 domain-containing protein [Halorubrum coriense]ELZ46320.1 hypothetical protein C464_10913 [Halorubrum coriense DSM 10284]